MKNASKKFSRILLFVIPLLMVLSVFAGSAYSIWMLDNVTNSDSASVDYEADPIRENAVFGGDYDYVMTGSRSYDVYFMSQMCDIETHILEQSGTISAIQINSNGDRIQNSAVPNYTMKAAPVPYTTEKTYNVATSVLDHFQDYGLWTDASGEPLTTDITEDQNRYFIRYQSVTELTPDQVENLGNPYFRLFDTSDWPLSFMCWTPCYDLPVYKQQSLNDVFPAPVARVASTNAQWPDYIGRKVQGYAPYSTVFTSLYAGTLLEYYERLSYGGISYTNTEGEAKTFQYVWYVNGRPSIFFFPVYTSDGKNYTGSTDSATTGQNDTFKLVENTEGDNTEGDLFNFDGVFTEAINDAFTANDTNYFSDRGDTVRYECYRLSRRWFDSNTTYQVITDPFPTGGSAGWFGKKLGILTLVPELVAGDYINMYLVVKVDTDVTAYTGSRWNPIKSQTTVNGDTVTIIDEDEYGIIDGALESQGLMKYYTRGQLETLAQADTTYFDANESRDYYMVYERFYTPKLIGGPTGQVSYQNNDFIFTKEGIGNEAHNWVLRDVDLSGNSTFDYSFTQELNGVTYNVTATFPSYYFGVLVSDLDVQLRQRIDYSLSVRPDNPETDNPPVFASSTTTGDATTYYQSDDIFINVFDSAYVSEGDDITVVANGASMTFAEARAMGLTLQNNMNFLKVRDPGVYTLMFQCQFIESTKFYDTSSGGYTELTFYDRSGNSLEFTYTAGANLYDANRRRVYSTSTNYPDLIVTRELPDELYGWGYNFSELFVNICDTTAGAGEAIVTGANAGNTLKHMVTQNMTNYVDTNSYTLHSERYAYGDYLGINDSLSITTTEGNLSVETTVTDFNGLFEAIEASGNKELVDLVTGQILTRNNITKFRMEKYYVFVIKWVGQDISYAN